MRFERTGGCLLAASLLTSLPAPAQVRFTDVTAEAGIDFTHTSGAAGKKYLPETMGSGVGFFDYDTDGDQDLLFVNGIEWPEAKSARNPSTSTRARSVTGRSISAAGSPVRAPRDAPTRTVR